MYQIVSSFDSERMLNSRTTEIVKVLPCFDRTDQFGVCVTVTTQAYKPTRALWNKTPFMVCLKLYCCSPISRSSNIFQLVTPVLIICQFWCATFLIVFRIDFFVYLFTSLNFTVHSFYVILCSGSFTLYLSLAYCMHLLFSGLIYIGSLPSRPSFTFAKIFVDDCLIACLLA